MTPEDCIRLNHLYRADASHRPQHRRDGTRHVTISIPLLPVDGIEIDFDKLHAETLLRNAKR